MVLGGERRCQPRIGYTSAKQRAATVSAAHAGGATQVSSGPPPRYPLTPVLAMPVVMKRCSMENTSVMGSSVRTVIARM